MTSTSATINPKTPDVTLADAAAFYRALKSHDSRFDGRFFVGVSTTRVYCRPVCRVRVPREKNCSFYPSAAAAEHAGFRPCLRCRPELAPGWASVDIGSRLARATAQLIDGSLHRGDSLAEIASRIGVSDRHLRRLFEAHFNVTPIEYLQTQRLLLAKRLLTDTDMRVIDVAGAAGFGSLRRLNASMRTRYRLSPTQLRGGRNRASPDGVAGALRFSVAVRQPFDFNAMCAFFQTRALDGLEHVTDDAYLRVLSVPGPDDKVLTGWFALREDRGGALQLEVSQQLAPVVAVVLAQARQLFDLDADPQDYLPVLGNLANARPGLRVPGAVSGFEIAVRAVLGQQITVKAARTLASRFVRRFGERCRFEDNECVEAGLVESKTTALAHGLTHAFPEPKKIARVAVSSIAELGIIRRRAEAIKSLATAIKRGELDLTPTAPLDQTLAALNAQAGIGDWTAQYIAMRAMRWPDAFIAADYGVMKALNVKTAPQARDAVEHWRPWRAYAVMHLWNSLSAQ